ncbi:phosphatase PAP2 family protein [Lachnospiraceae bacterium LCP25S3_G4]
MEWLISLDGNLLVLIQEYVRMEWMNDIWRGITHLGDKGWFWIAISMVLLLCKKTRKVGFIASVSLLLGFLLTNVWLKNFIERPRPFIQIDSLIPLISAPKDFSFPSGHTCSSFAVASVFYRMLPRKVGICAIFLAILVGFSRLYLGVHYPTDVLAGAIVGVLSGYCAEAIYNVIHEKIFKKA